MLLLFKKKFLPAIRSGGKTQTVRLWKRPMARAGQRSYIPGAGYIAVEGVDVVDLEELTDDDAIPDGFTSADALRREIERIYGDRLANGYRAYRLRFSLLPEEEQQRIREQRRREKQAQQP